MVNNIKLPKWLEERYDKLYQNFKNSKFRMDEASRVLQNELGSSSNEVPAVLSELRKAGWITVEMDPTDARKKIYTLNTMESIYERELSFKKGKLTRSDIESILKKAADLIRTRVDYKFILVLLFLKQISDKWDQEYKRAYKEALEDGLSEKEATEEASQPSFHDFDLPEEYHWEKLRSDVENLPENFSNALKTIAERNPQLKDVIDTFDFVEFTSSRENAEILRQLVELFSEKKLHHVDPDILGDSYEWILRYFAPQKAKEGEVYTPREVIKLIVEILDPQPGESIYDPASASNGMLIISYNHVKDNYGKKEAEKLFLYGQEVNQKTLALGSMNLYIHDIKNAQTALGDTLLYPKFKEGDGIKQFDVVIANPPWNLDGFPEETLKKGDFWRERYPFGFVNKQSADWAWIQHMLASANNKTGRVGVIIDNGALLRGGKEKKIRTEIIKSDLIECVILLPEKLFYNTDAPGAIIIFNKNKPEEKTRNILFINASEEYEDHPEVRKLKILDKGNIENIVKHYQDFGSTDGFARAVSLEEVDENEYNLNVPLYAFSEEEIEEINIRKEWEELKELENDFFSNEEEVREYLEKILDSDQEFKDTSIGKIPTSWDLKQVQDVFEVKTGTTPSTKKSEYWEDGTVVWVTPADMSKIDGLKINNSDRKITSQALKETNLNLLPKNSIILSTRAPVGYVTLTAEKSTFNQGCKGLVPKNRNRVDPVFYSYFLLSKKDRLQNLSGGSTFRELSKDTLKKFDLPVPTLQEQQKIAKLLSLLDLEIQIENKRKIKLQKIKQGLMNDLLTGKRQLQID